MVREYTSEVEEDVKYLLKCSLSPKMEQEDLDAIARDMTINVEEYKDLNELCKEKQKKAVKKYDELIEKVHLIFEDLRNYDDSFSKKWIQRKMIFMILL